MVEDKRKKTRAYKVWSRGYVRSKEKPFEYVKTKKRKKR